MTFVTILLLLAVVILVSILGMGIAMKLAQRPLAKEALLRELAKLVAKLRRRHPETAHSSLSIKNPHLELSLGDDAPANEAQAQRSLPHFHVASVGKLFTTVLIAKKVEEGVIGWDSRITELLPSTDLGGLFVAAEEVEVLHLLSHRSGIADYYADKPVDGGKPLFKTLGQQAQRTWTPADLLEYTRSCLRPRGPVGAQFHYSDSGFILLGLIVEQLYKLPFHQALQRHIFDPLGMRASYMPLRSDADKHQSIRPLYIDGFDLSGPDQRGLPALSMDWAGGGVVSTALDLLRFSTALFEGGLLNLSSLEQLKQAKSVFRRGMHYGAGMFELRFEEFTPLLKDWPRLYGHMGVNGTQLFYDPASRTHLTLSLGSDRFSAGSVMAIIQVFGLLRRFAPGTFTVASTELQADSPSSGSPQ